MGNPRARYTLEYKIEAVRMVRNGQSQSAVAKILGISSKTLNDWIKADDAGKLNGAGKRVSQPNKWKLRDSGRRTRSCAWSAISWEKRRHTSRRGRCEVCLD